VLRDQKAYCLVPQTGVNMTRLIDFMDAYAPGPGSPYAKWSPPVRVLANCGPNSARIVRAAYTPRLGEQMLAALFWWCYTQSQDLSENPVVQRHGGLDGGERQILVSHSRGTRYDLLILTPVVNGAAGTRVTPVLSAFQPRRHIGITSSPRSITSVALDEADRMRWMLSRADINVDARVAVLAVSELAMEGDFRLVLAAPPEELPTGATTSYSGSFRVPSPALSVTIDDGGQPLATAGVIGTDSTGRLLVTTAGHVVEGAIAADAKIMIGNAPATVVGKSHELTDSCLLAVAFGSMPDAANGGVLHRPPVLYMPATYVGAASGPKLTKITGFDKSIVSPTPFSGGRVYTDPDTIPGDSGAALIDSDDSIVGFAVARTAFGAPLEFSTWSWAAQVLAVHGLTA
jgi:hypothetical protein